MKKFIYFTEYKNLWLDLAVKLKDNLIAEPILCILDESEIQNYSNHFNDCLFFDYAKASIWFLEENTPINLDWINKILNDKDFLQIKDQAIRMMDRQDLFWWFRNLDRNDIFYYILIYFYNIINNNKPDFLLMAWTPHTVISFIIYNICLKLDIKTYSFYVVSILPILLIREWISWKFIWNNSILEENIRRILDKDIDKFLNKFNANSFEDPKYLRIQKSKDKFSIKNLYLRARKNLYLIWYSKIEYYGFSGIKDTISIMDKILFFFLKKKLININTKALNKAIGNDVNLNVDFVYFPLHYQPERTTNPDWWDYYDQIKALITLRQLIPNNIPIYVKEHYWQFSRWFQWYRWRSRFFYSTLSKIENLYILNNDLQSNILIQKSLMTASITGTTIIESICFWKPSLIMWYSWFEDFRWVTKLTNVTNIESILSNKWSINTFKEDINNLISQYWIFWTLWSWWNTYYSDYYNNNDNYELNNIYENVKSII